MPGMRRVGIRFGERLWELVEDEANHDGVSAAQWIREAAIMRCMWERSFRGIPDGIDVLQLIRDEQRADNEAMQKVIRDVLVNARDELETIIDRLPPDSARWLRGVYGLENEEAPGD